jgi:cytochrome c2
MRPLHARVLPGAITAAAALIAIASACGTDDWTTTNEIYVRFECGKCHGHDREGARTAPPLTGTGLASRWTETGLVEYLKDPQGVTRKNAHITLRNEQYPLKMPSYAAATQTDLTDLARFLLAH